MLLLIYNTPHIGWGHKKGVVTMSVEKVSFKVTGMT
jgi:hypothetical protein